MDISQQAIGQGVSKMRTNESVETTVFSGSWAATSSCQRIIRILESYQKSDAKKTQTKESAFVPPTHAENSHRHASVESARASAVPPSHSIPLRGELRECASLRHVGPSTCNVAQHAISGCLSTFSISVLVQSARRIASHRRRFTAAIDAHIYENM
jgi:hypothetical protein